MHNISDKKKDKKVLNISCIHCCIYLSSLRITGWYTNVIELLVKAKVKNKTSVLEQSRKLKSPSIPPPTFKEVSGTL